MRLHDPHRGRGFEHFLEAYKPHIRPDGQLRRLRQAFETDARYEEEFTLLYPWLRRAQQDWADQLVDRLLYYDGIRASFGDEDMATLRALYHRHAPLFASGRVDEAYLDSLEELALFFLYHDVRSVWLAGAYGRLEESAVDYLFDIAKTRRNAPIQRLMRCFCKGMTIELSQMQRVFICYERHVQSVVLGHMNGVSPEMESTLRSSLKLVREHANQLARRFFDGLEDRAPDLGPLLPQDADARGAFFLEALTRSVDSLSDTAETVPPLRAFGRAMAGAPLRPEHRGIVEAALIATLKHAFGAKWEGDLQRAWTVLYKQVSLTVLDARDEARALIKAQAAEKAAEKAAELETV